MACCSYKVARRGMLLMNMIVMLFSIIFLAVGGASLALEQDEVGCNCESIPPSTTLPVIAFQAPASGLIALGVFTLVASIIGCIGAIRERTPMIIGYIVLMVLIIIMQFGFGTAAAAVASGAAPQIAGPFIGVLNENYKYFDWMVMSGFFPSACYFASGNVTITDFITGAKNNVTFNYPACNFYGQCANAYQPGYEMSAQENYCCNRATKSCDRSRVNCISGNDCVMNFLNTVGAPVAIVAFLALCIETVALVCACIVRPGKSANYGA